VPSTPQLPPRGDEEDGLGRDGEAGFHLPDLGGRDSHRWRGRTPPPDLRRRGPCTVVERGRERERGRWICMEELE